MKKLSTAIVLFASLAATQAFGIWNHQYFAQVAASEEVSEFVDSNSLTLPFELMKIEDTGERFRCPCYNFRLVFDNAETGESKSYIVATSDYDFDGTLKIESITLEN